MDVDQVTRHVAGKCVSGVTQPDPGRLAIHFSDGSILLVERLRQGLGARVAPGTPPGEILTSGVQPTPRQREYLAFVARYIAKFGVAPAESDIQRHFLVSAPSVNQMIQTLERRGFITRERGVPRSIRIVYAPQTN